MKLRPKHRVTRRFKEGVNFFHDKTRSRYVVFRRCYGITKKTSVRYAGDQTREDAETTAKSIADRLRAWPAEELAKFQFSK